MSKLLSIQLPEKVRSILNCDRLAIYQFNPDWSGHFVAESYARGWESCDGQAVKNPQPTRECKRLSGVL